MDIIDRYIIDMMDRYLTTHAHTQDFKVPRNLRQLREASKRQVEKLGATARVTPMETAQAYDELDISLERHTLAAPH